MMLTGYVFFFQAFGVIVQMHVAVALARDTLRR